MTQWIHFPSGIPTYLNKANSTLNYSGPSQRHTHKHSHKLISSPFVPAGSMLGVNGTRAWHFRAGCTSFVPVIFSVWANVSSDKASWSLRGTGPRTAGGKFACVSEFICMTKPARAVLLVKRGLHQSWLNRIRGPLWHHPCVEVIAGSGSACRPKRNCLLMVAQCGVMSAGCCFFSALPLFAPFTLTVAMH